MNTETRLSYRPNEAARALGISRDTVFKLLASGDLRSLKIGQARLIPADSLRDFLADREANG